MAVASDSAIVFSSSINAPCCYVSSSGYYGFVPVVPGAGQVRDCCGVFDGGEQPAFDGGAQYSNQSDCGAMETDEDGYGDHDDNNCCVIPVVSRDGGGRGADRNCRFWRLDAGQRRRNRKRGAAGEPGPAEMKKSRGGIRPLSLIIEGSDWCRGGGNCSIHLNTGSVKKRGCVALHNGSALRVDESQNGGQRQALPSPESCCWAAGNYRTLAYRSHDDTLSIGGSKLSESDSEYEKMLLETHGCSVYHLHRLQQRNVNGEAEL